LLEGKKKERNPTSLGANYIYPPESAKKKGKKKKRRRGNTCLRNFGRKTSIGDGRIEKRLRSRIPDHFFLLPHPPVKKKKGEKGKQRILLRTFIDVPRSFGHEKKERGGGERKKGERPKTTGPP